MELKWKKKLKETAKPGQNWKKQEATEKQDETKIKKTPKETG